MDHAEAGSPEDNQRGTVIFSPIEGRTFTKGETLEMQNAAIWTTPNSQGNVTFQVQGTLIGSPEQVVEIIRIWATKIEEFIHVR